MSLQNRILVYTISSKRVIEYSTIQFFLCNLSNH